MAPPLNVLFLCTGNSARSILGEALATTRSNGRLIGYSAGSRPNGKVNPFAAELCEAMHYPAHRLRSKSWDEFAQPNAPAMDLIITVCDNAAHEVCPVWPGHPATAHWGLPDPAAVVGSDADKRAAFRAIRDAMQKRIDLLLEWPLHALDNDARRAALTRIGEIPVLDDAAEPLFRAR